MLTRLLILLLADKCHMTHFIDDDDHVSVTKLRRPALYNRITVSVTVVENDESTAWQQQLTVLQQFYISQHPQLRTGGFCWSKVLMLSCLC